MYALSEQSLGKLKIISKNLSREREYWNSRLHNLTKAAFPPDFNSPLPADFHTRQMMLPRDTAQRLHDLAKHSDPGLHTVLMFAISLLLAHRTQRRDVAVGTLTWVDGPAATPTDTNLMAIRTTVDDEATLHDQLRVFAQSYQTDIRHQRFPFEVLLEEWGGGAQGNPLFDVMVVLQNIQTFRLPELQPFANLFFCFDRNTDGLLFSVHYNAVLFTESTVQELMETLMVQLHEFQNDLQHPVKHMHRRPALADEPHRRVADREATEGYWKNALQDYKQIVFPAPRNASNERDRHELWEKRNRPYVASFRAFCHHQDVTPEEVCFAAYLYALYMLSYDGDLLVGLTRGDAGSALLPEVPFRINMEGVSSGLTLVQQIRALRNQQASYEALKLDALKTLMDVEKEAGNPFYTTCFSFRDEGGMPGHDTAVAPGNFQVSDTHCNFEVTFTKEDRMVATWTFRPAMVDENAVQQLLNYVLSILDFIVASPDAPLHKHTFISWGEQQRLMHFNDTASPYNTDVTVIELFEQQVAQHPNAKAIQMGESVLTYGQLNSRSNQLARTLLEITGGEQKIIPIVAERSLEMFIGIYAILKAGCAYLPVPREYPQERIDYVVTEANAGVVLALSKDEGRFNGHGKVLILDREEAYQDDDTNLSIASQADSLAYVIYTSGSTGQPKGVMIQNRALVNRLNWMQKCYPLNAGDVILHKTSMAFDVSVWEIFWWALQGASVVLLTPGQEKDPAAMATVIFAHRVSVLHFVPPMLRAFLNFFTTPETTAQLKSLRAVFASGEALSRDIVTAFNMLFRPEGPRLINLYGPTEATVDVTVFECPRQAAPAIIPIGKPIDNTRLYVLDKFLEAQPIGSVGELCLAGDQLALGYLHKPELTAQRFIEHPHVPAERIYRTGDLARWLPDGNVEFLGRIDNQVKIRGYRIELGEIEHQLLQVAGVRDAVVVCREENGSKYLCAYYVAPLPLEAHQLAEHLGVRLPAYMVPSGFVWLKEMPLNANGKTDRKQLLDLRQTADVPYQAPRNTVEKVLAEALMETLNLKDVSIKDSVFRIGLDSMSAIQVVTLLNERLGLELPLGIFWEFPVVEDLGVKIESEIEATARSNAKRIARLELEKNMLDFLAKYESEHTARVASRVDMREVEAIYPMSEMEKAMTYYTVAFPEAPQYLEQVVYSERLVNLDLERFRHVVEQMIEKHATFRTGFDLQTHSHIIYKTFALPFHHHNLEALEVSDQYTFIERVRVECRTRPLDLLIPTLQFHLFQTGAEQYVIMLQFHHAVIDGWSVQAFMGEVYETYMKIMADETFRPALLRCHYKDQILSELISKREESLTPYWLAELNGYRRFVFPQPEQPVRPQTSKVLKIARDKAYLVKLQAFSVQHDVTLHDLGFAAYVYALHTLTLERDILVGHVTNTRPAQEDGDKLLGCFLNTVPVRLALSGPERVIDFLKRVSRKFTEQKRFERISLLDIKNRVDEPSGIQNPFFDTKYNFIDFSKIRGLDTSSDGVSEPETGIVNYLEENTLCDFCIDLTGGAQMLVSWTFAPANIDEEFVRLLLRSTLSILDFMVANPYQLLLPENFIAEADQPRALGFQETLTRARQANTDRTLAVASPRPSRSAHEQAIVDLLLKIKPSLAGMVHAESALDELGIDSLGMIALQWGIRETFHHTIPIAELFSLVRVSAIAGHLEQLQEPDQVLVET
ncbi:amino acid adenylation domain-containing protein [Chryseolinea serpens]|uniref:Amino acid adenylation domain-containing protein n=1 Tax=Chryseolinea serpens TaxID=947013 RepID=A0A1M5VAR6_9BACT|nr:non-ribosomal peptide synthetase [Chryseolinea serpens]SHH72023.1 amino acid adenylation domain-containing protein [Chryseolinea serpens]